MPHYVLPDLDYDYGALEPHVSGQIMELHHGKHHKAYVDKANDTLEKLEQARAAKDFSRLAGLEKALAFNLSGHVLHSLFWKNMMPRGGDAPSGELARAIAKCPIHTDRILRETLEKAARAGEIPAGTDVDAVVPLVFALTSGVSLYASFLGAQSYPRMIGALREMVRAKLTLA